eukprot:Rhum_TRINITY_DN14334_c8_g1::Rhum_TRINITY_DN14334_c8_g1_i1::g.81987::m.81987
MPSQDDALAAASSEEESPTDLGKTLPMKHKAAATAAAAATHQQTVADGTKRQPPKSRRVVDSPRTMAAFAAAKQKHHPIGINRHASAASASSLRSARSAPAKKSDTAATTTAKRGSKAASGKTTAQAKKQPAQKAAPPVVPTLRVDSVREFMSLSPNSSFRKDSPRGGDGLVGGTPRGTTTGPRGTPRLRSTAGAAAVPNTARAVRPRLSPRSSAKSPRMHGGTGGAPLQRYPSAPGSPLRSSTATRDPLSVSSSTQPQLQSTPLQHTGSGPNRDRPPPSPALDSTASPQLRRSPREADVSGTTTPTSATAATGAAAAAATATSTTTPRRRTSSTSPSQRSLQIQHLMRDTYSSGIRNRSLSPFRRSSSPATLAADGGGSGSGGNSGDASPSGGISPRGSVTPRTPYSRVTTTQLTPRTFANISSVASLRSQSPPAEVFVKGAAAATSGGGGGGGGGNPCTPPPPSARGVNLDLSASRGSNNVWTADCAAAAAAAATATSAHQSHPPPPPPPASPIRGGGGGGGAQPQQQRHLSPARRAGFASPLASPLAPPPPAAAAAAAASATTVAASAATKPRFSPEPACTPSFLAHAADLQLRIKDAHKAFYAQGTL